jgi:PPOX class probable F420-dependent enzyme
MNFVLPAELEPIVRDEHIAWLTTVRADGMPLPTPVWFIWQDGAFVIYSQSQALKLHNIRHNPNVALHFNTDASGEAFVVFQATAQMASDAPASLDVPAYQAKYRDHISMIGYTPERLAGEFSVALRVTPVRVRYQLAHS